LKQFYLLNEGIQNEENSFKSLQTIKYQKINFGEKIGSGATSDVYKGFYFIFKFFIFYFIFIFFLFF
jgi:hypothetical protein